MAKIESLSFRKCPGNFVSQWVYAWIDVFSLFEKGIMPFHGTYLEQPNKAIEILRVIQAHKADRIIKERQAQSRKVRT